MTDQLGERIVRESAFLADVVTELERVIVGQRALIDGMLVGLLADGHARRRTRRIVPAHPVHSGPPAVGPARYARVQPEVR